MMVDWVGGIQKRHNASRFQQSLVWEMTRPEPGSRTCGSERALSVSSEFVDRLGLRWIMANKKPASFQGRIVAVPPMIRGLVDLTLRPWFRTRRTPGLRQGTRL